MGTTAERMMVSLLNVLLLWFALSGEAQLSEISQPASFQTVDQGRTVTISCRINSKVRTRIWCKLNAARRLRVVSSTDTFYSQTTFNEQSHRYSVKSDNISNHLIISAAMMEDAGTYFCGVLDLTAVQFGQGTFLVVKGANMISDSVVQEPESWSVQPGDSVTLSCSVQIVHCAAELTSVMWLKNSHHSAPQRIYPSGNQNRVCQRTVSGETTCVYELLMRNVSSDDAGTYYCVVTSCGHTTSGNGTRVNIHRGDTFTTSVQLSPAVSALMLSNIVLGLVTLLLVWTLCKNHKKEPTAASRSSDGSVEGNQTGDAVVYSAVCPAPRQSSCRPAPVKYSPDAVVYSDVKYHQQD